MPPTLINGGGNVENVHPESGGSCASGAANPPHVHLPLHQHGQLPQILVLPNQNGITRGRMLGSGTFGEVYEASLEGEHWPTWLREKSLMVKVLQEGFGIGCRPDRGRIFDEFILGSFRHPSLVGCLGFTQSPPFCALFERCNLGSLWDALKGSRADQAPLVEAIRLNGVHLVIQLAEGIGHLHNQELVHCDLHKRNVLLHSDEDNILQLRIADFGLCSRIHDRRSHRLIRLQERDQYRRRHPFVAPELVLGGDYSKASDMWAVGLIAEELLGVERWTGKPIYGKCKVRLRTRALQALTACSSLSSAGRPSIKDFLVAFSEHL